MAKRPPSDQPRWQTMVRETFAFAEFASLMRDPIYRGEDVPRGDGRLVVIIPGLFGTDFYLWPLRRWIARIGYRPSTSGLWVNAGCADRLTSDVEKWIDRQRSDGQIVLIGHSRGGVLARALAARLPNRVSHLILLGSPVGGAVRLAQTGADRQPSGVTMNAVAQASNTARRILDPDCEFPQCGCGFINDMRRALAPETVVLSIYTRDDTIAPPEVCIVTGARNVEVGGTHSGLVFNPAVYREIARSLP
jgi:pimeloyl-ACP methyl ester carboxylesterase